MDRNEFRTYWQGLLPSGLLTSYMEASPTDTVHLKLGNATVTCTWNSKIWKLDVKLPLTGQVKTEFSIAPTYGVVTSIIGLAVDEFLIGNKFDPEFPVERKSVDPLPKLVSKLGRKCDANEMEEGDYVLLKSPQGQWALCLKGEEVFRIVAVYLDAVEGWGRHSMTTAELNDELTAFSIDPAYVSAILKDAGILTLVEEDLSPSANKHRLTKSKFGDVPYNTFLLIEDDGEWFVVTRHSTRQAAISKNYDTEGFWQDCEGSIENIDKNTPVFLISSDYEDAILS